MPETLSGNDNRPTDGAAVASPGGADETDLSRRMHELETWYVDRWRCLQRENADLAVMLDRRIEEIGALTRLAQDREEAGQARLTELQHRLVRAEDALRALRNSTSWRLTRPLRRFTRLLGRTR